MHTRRQHYRAHCLSTLREFPGLAALAADLLTLDGGVVCYVTEDYDLVADPLVSTASLLRENDMTAWHEFCRHRLGIAGPSASDELSGR